MVKKKMKTMDNSPKTIILMTPKEPDKDTQPTERRKQINVGF